MAYVVPTKDRPDDLRKLLASLARQTVRPAQVVIVDGSDPPVDAVCAEFPDLPLTYVRVFPPSLARQRNAGMAALGDGVEIAGYLDDDLELAEDATERMAAFWAAAGPGVGGAAFTIVNQPLAHPLLSLFSRAFLMSGPGQGRVLSSGFATPITPRAETLRTDWLYGGATLWRRGVVARHAYDEWYIGHGFLEDLDYSHRVSRTDELYVVADARCWHWPRPVAGRRNVALGRQQVVNRVYFVRKAARFSGPALAWALTGQLLRNLAEPLKDRDAAGLYRAWGNLLGLADVLRGRLGPVAGIWK
jgi:glycosyltransferase involved in cell wall biosynthesis